MILLLQFYRVLFPFKLCTLVVLVCIYYPRAKHGQYGPDPAKHFLKQELKIQDHGSGLFSTQMDEQGDTLIELPILLKCTKTSSAFPLLASFYWLQGQNWNMTGHKCPQRAPRSIFQGPLSDSNRNQPPPPYTVDITPFCPPFPTAPNSTLFHHSTLWKPI